MEEIVRRTGTLYPRDYWPRDCIIGNWTGGTVGTYLRHFPRYYGNTPVRDVGLIASEGRMTIPFANGTPSGVLDILTHYFEFLPEEEADSPQPTAVAAHEVNSHLTFRLNGTNLANEHYVDRVGGGHYIPGPGRQIMATVTVRR